MQPYRPGLSILAMALRLLDALLVRSDREPFQRTILIIALLLALVVAARLPLPALPLPLSLP